MPSRSADKGRASTEPLSAARELTIGLIADTHGLLRPEAVECLVGSDYIIHAGDIGNPDVLQALAGMAPLTAVRGNNDSDAWAKNIPDSAVLRVGAVSIYVLHDVAGLNVDPARRGYHAVVTGHSHRPVAERRDGVWFVNPGSAGPRRFRLPVSVGRLRVTGTHVNVQLVTLHIDS
jgi:uncharacterized protein